MVRLRIIRTFSAATGSRMNIHAPIMLSTDPDVTVARSRNLIDAAGERDVQISIGPYCSKIPWSTRDGAANFEYAGDRICAIPTNAGFGWRQTSEINGKYSACGKTRPCTKTGAGVAVARICWRAMNSSSHTTGAC